MRLLVLIAVTTMLAASLSAAPKPNDVFVVVPGTSTGSAGSVAPNVVDGSDQWSYDLTVPAGIPWSQTIPVSLAVTNGNGQTNEVTVEAGATGVPQIGVLAVSAPWKLNDDGIAVVRNLVVSAGGLGVGDYAKNISLEASESGDIKPWKVTIHVNIHVTQAYQTCFFTDSEFNLLVNCSGVPVEGQSGGTFQIVRNPTQVVATNPGQFYYNLIWQNSGSTQTVAVNLLQTNLVPKGANSVHAATFDASAFVKNKATWDAVNAYGTPCGTIGPCVIEVPAGHILWVTWHVEYAGIGSTVTPSMSCPGDISISATGTVQNAGGQLYTCTGLASGYLKQ